MKPQQIADRLSLEVLRCQRMDLSLGVLEMGVEVAVTRAASAGRLSRETQREVGECLRESLRRYDSIGLTRGGCFLLVLPHVTRRGLAAAGERLRREIGSAAARSCSWCWPSPTTTTWTWARRTCSRLQRSMDEARDQGKTVTGPPIAWA